MNFVQYLTEKYRGWESENPFKDVILENSRLFEADDEDETRWVTYRPPGTEPDEKGIPLLIHTKTGAVLNDPKKKSGGKDEESKKEKEELEKVDSMNSLMDADRGLLLKIYTQKMDGDAASAKKMSTSRLLKKVKEWRKKNR